MVHARQLVARQILNVHRSQQAQNVEFNCHQKNVPWEAVGQENHGRVTLKRRVG